MKKIYMLALGLLSSVALNAQVADGDFEDGVGGGWTEASTTFGTPICDEATCGNCGGPCVPNSGTYYVWFGGATATETGSVEQSVFFASGTTGTLEMMVKMPATGTATAADKMEVSVDGSVVSTVTALDSATYMDAYAMLSVDVSSYADGANHTIKIEGFQTSATSFNILVDDVVLKVDGGVTSVFEYEMGESEVIVYPNPANEAINLTFREVYGDVNVTITDISGKVISNEIVDAQKGKQYVYGTEELVNGVYVVSVVQNGTVLNTEKVTVAK